VVLEAVAACVLEATGGVVPDGVAMGVPGPADPRAGLVYAAPNLHGWEGLEAGPLLSDLLGCPVAIQNDANLAGYAEWAAGAGQGTRDFVFLTVSTGVGGALIVDGELFVGAAGTAGEFGHVPASLDGPACGQGHPGCLEGIASGTAIALRARAALAAGEPSLLAATGDSLDARDVQDAAEAGDALSRRLFDDAGRALGRAIGGLVNSLSPDVVAIGGGLIGAGELLFAPLRAAVGEVAFEVPLQRCRIVAAALGTDAGLVGAAAWALRRFAAPA
jgi:glucokinase